MVEDAKYNMKGAAHCGRAATSQLLKFFCPPCFSYPGTPFFLSFLFWGEIIKFIYYLFVDGSAGD